MQNKTEVLVGTSNQLSKLSSIIIKTGEDTLSASSYYVRNRGAYFDKTPSMNNFVNEKCKSAVHNIKCVSRIRRFLTKKAAEAFVNAY